MKNFYKKGISMIEVIIVIVVIGIMVAIAVPQFSKMKNAQILKSTSQEVFALVNRAHSQTLDSLDSSEYGVHFQTDKAVLFKGISYSSSDLNNEEVEISLPATISSISPSGNANVYFSRLTGMPNPSGTTTITVSIPTDNATKIITISNTGAISLN